MPRYLQRVMLIETEWHPFWISYEWWTDIGASSLSGLGGVLVGVGAIVVAARTHSLAKLVRDDEQRRDLLAAEVRYREQLFRTVDLAVTALLEFRGQLAAAMYGGQKPVWSAIADVRSRLGMIDAIADADDKRVVRAVLKAFEEAVDVANPAVLHNALGKLAGVLPMVLADDRKIEELVRVVEAEAALPD